MHRLTEDRLLAERVTLSHIPAPDDPAQDMTFRPSPAFAARVPTLDQLPDPLNAGWHEHLHTAQDTTELPAVARAVTRQDRPGRAYGDIIGYVVTAAIWAALGASAALLIGGAG